MVRFVSNTQILRRRWLRTVMCTRRMQEDCTCVAAIAKTTTQRGGRPAPANNRVYVCQPMGAAAMSELTRLDAPLKKDFRADLHLSAKETQTRQRSRSRPRLTLMDVVAAGMTSGEAKPSIRKLNIAVRCSGWSFNHSAYLI